MFNDFLASSIGSGFPMIGMFGAGLIGILLFTLLAVGLMALKGYALWHAAKRDDKGWFIAILLINIFGILELIYLYYVAKIWGNRTPAASTSTTQASNTEPKV